MLEARACDALGKGAHSCIFQADQCSQAPHGRNDCIGLKAEAGWGNGSKPGVIDRALGELGIIYNLTYNLLLKPSGLKWLDVSTPLEKGVGRERRRARHFPTSQPGAFEKLFAQVLTYFAWQKQPPPLTKEVKIAKYNPAGCENTEPVAPRSSRRQFGNSTAGDDHRPSAMQGEARRGLRGEQKPALGQLLPQRPEPRQCCPFPTTLPGCKSILEMKLSGPRSTRAIEVC